MLFNTDPCKVLLTRDLGFKSSLVSHPVVVFQSNPFLFFFPAYAPNHQFSFTYCWTQKSLHRSPAQKSCTEVLTSGGIKDVIRLHYRYINSPQPPLWMHLSNTDYFPLKNTFTNINSSNVNAVTKMLSSKRDFSKVTFKSTEAPCLC